MLVGEGQGLDRTRIGRLAESLAQLLEKQYQIILVTSGAVAAGAPAMGLVRAAKTIPQKQACAAVGQNLLMALYEQLFSQIILVTSGAVAAGAPAMGLVRAAKTIPQKQACAAVGQNLLMALYEQLFSQEGHHTAQILLDDFRNRERYLNARNTLETLISAQILPIVNENDTVVVEEIKFGDNDNLSSQVAALVQADLLLILSTVEGFYEPPAPKAYERPKVIPIVTEIGAAHFGYAQDVESPSSVTTGGMKSKLIAIEKAAHYGIPSVLASGLNPGVIERVLAGEEEGTLFLPLEERLSARKHWILHSLAPVGSLTVDKGAVRAVLEQGKSLLSIGITSVSGEFGSGNSVRVLGPDGEEIARGLSYYSSAEVEMIQGGRSDEIESRLGYIYYDEVIHRDNLVPVNRGAGPRE